MNRWVKGWNRQIPEDSSRGFSPYFECWYSRQNLEDERDIFLQTTPEFQEDISLLAVLIQLCHQVGYRSNIWTFQLVRLVDFLGVDSFLELCTDQLDVPTAELRNSNSIRKVRRLMWMLPCPPSKQQDNWRKSKCPVCQKFAICVIPLKANWVEIPCYMNTGGTLITHQVVWQMLHRYRP